MSENRPTFPKAPYDDSSKDDCFDFLSGVILMVESSTRTLRHTAVRPRAVPTTPRPIGNSPARAWAEPTSLSSKPEPNYDNRLRSHPDEVTDIPRAKGKSDPVTWLRADPRGTTQKAVHERQMASLFYRALEAKLNPPENISEV